MRSFLQSDRSSRSKTDCMTFRWASVLSRQMCFVCMLLESIRDVGLTVRLQMPPVCHVPGVQASPMMQLRASGSHVCRCFPYVQGTDLGSQGLSRSVFLEPGWSLRRGFWKAWRIRSHL